MSITTCPKPSRLVRDGVPRILEKRGEKLQVKQVQGEEFKAALLERVQHDANAVSTKPNVEGFADLQESLNAAAREHGCSIRAIKDACRFKRTIQGAFVKGMILLGREGRVKPE